MKDSVKKTKKWNISPILYGISSLCAFTGVAITASQGNLGLDLVSLSFGTGVVLWTGAAMHGLYRQATASNSASTLAAKSQPDQNAETNTPSSALTVSNQYRPSTHATFNSTLHISAACGFIISDGAAALAQATTPSLRMGGSALWLTGALKLTQLARAQAKKETTPEFEIQPCGIKPAPFNLAIELEFLLAAVLYGIATYYDSRTRTDPLKIIGGTCWFLAGLYDTVHAIIECCRHHDPELQTTLLIQTPSNDIVIPVEEPENSSPVASNLRRTRSS